MNRHENMNGHTSEPDADGMNRVNTFAPVVVAPTYNNARTLPDIVRRVAALGLPSIVVNDGSTDDTAALLADWTRQPHATSTIVVTHAVNRGKAAALRTGFDVARQRGFTHAGTVDTDGQLDPEELRDLFDAARLHPHGLVLGTRGPGQSGAPGSHQLGWWMSALGIWLESGERVLDSQCGLRVYPLRMFEVVHCRAGRFGFEAEVITRAAWAACPIVSVPVACRYFTDERHISHFRPWRDGIRSFFMHARLTIRRLAPWPHPTIAPAERCTSRLPHPKPSSVKPARPAETATITGMARGTWADWLNPLMLWQRLRQDRFEQLLVAAALGIGTFMAALPLGGWQIVLAGYASWRLRVHLLPTLLGSLLCVPPVGGVLSRVSIVVGHLLFHARLPDGEGLDPSVVEHWPLLARVPLAWPVGGVIVGFFANWITIPVFVYVFRLIPVRADPPACSPAP